MRISEWSSDVCSSDLRPLLQFDMERRRRSPLEQQAARLQGDVVAAAGMAGRCQVLCLHGAHGKQGQKQEWPTEQVHVCDSRKQCIQRYLPTRQPLLNRSEENTSELQSLMRISYAVFCLKKKTQIQRHT